MQLMRRGRTALIIPLLALTVLGSGCATVDENPLNVNGDRRQTGGSSNSSSPAPGAPTDDATNSVADSGQWGNDPLGIAQDGATLCGVQPQKSFQQYTLLLHNPTLETFTFSDITLGFPEGLSVVSAEITPANKEGHHHHGAGQDAAGAHSGHGATPTPSASAAETSTFLVEPVPAQGFVFEPDAHIDIVVRVALDETVETGTAENVVVDFSSPARDYSVAHPLNITVERTSCS
ncbi:hypothetical protein V6S67_18330 [Arthrobacter sp. Soc17.1.1.1]|uniref:hypothetical protein n=1 Tax=Arthrobacter sp. Soc17.1.1.1 TaxID=3121277 RepID=UPI002FE482C5